MKNTFLLGFLMMVALVMAACGDTDKNDRNKDAPPIKTEFKIDSDAFQAAIDSVEGALFIDVRTPMEYVKGHIPGAMSKNILDGSFRAFIDTLDRNTPMIVYCQRGRRSGRAANSMKELGFTQIYDLQGGLDQWMKESRETVKGRK